MNQPHDERDTPLPPLLSEYLAYLASTRSLSLLTQHSYRRDLVALVCCIAAQHQSEHETGMKSLTLR